MAVRNWKRMREKGVRSRDTDPVGSSEPNPWDEPTGTVRSADTQVTLSRLDTLAPPRSDDAQAARYSEWAERLRAKREAAQESIQRASGAAPAPGPTAPSNYWATEAVFAESRRVADEESTSRPDADQVRRLLDTLDLREGASPTEIGMAYRRLAKEHHPDRFVEAAGEVQLVHADRMRDINRAYRRLKDLQLA